MTFLTRAPALDRRLPFVSPGRKFKIAETGPCEVLSIRYAGDRFGDSVGFIESACGVPTTTRAFTVATIVTSIAP